MDFLKSRFATSEDIEHPLFEELNRRFIDINLEFDLPDHTKINKERFSWYGIKVAPMFYAARLWEYPFAILAGELSPGMKVADVGCGTTPFTPYIADVVGKENVYGFDSDYISAPGKESNLAFGVTDDFIQKAGINFDPSDLSAINADDNMFDVVYCISVLEHIPDITAQMKGLKELVRIVKPGGKLILTVDLGLNLPLTSPIDILKYSGLVPIGNIDFSWPLERFVRYKETCADVFGIILKKDENMIKEDYEGSKFIPQHKSYQRSVDLSYHRLTNYNESMFIQEFRMNRIKALLKLMAGRYNF